MESPSRAKAPSWGFWLWKTNVFLAVPMLLSLCSIGVGITFIVCTRTFLSSFHFFLPEFQAPVQLLRMNSTYFPGQGTMLSPEMDALKSLEKLQGPRKLSATIKAWRFSQPTPKMRAHRKQTSTPCKSRRVLNPISHQMKKRSTSPSPEFMQTPTINERARQRAAALQRQLKRKSSAGRRRWLLQNWSTFQILKVDNISDQFNDRMQEFFCTYNQSPHLNLNPDYSSSSPQETLTTKTVHEMDEKHICDVSTPGNPAFCTQRFFLTWMSPVASFGPRERLGLESIFKHHPRACVVILSRTMDSDDGTVILAPFRARGFRILAVTPALASLFADLPAARWFKRLRNGAQDPGCINLMQNLSNLMRLATLYRYGGVYLDTDVIVLRSFAALRNAVGAQSSLHSGRWTRLNNAVLVFDRAHPMVLELLREFAASFDGSRWGWNGPYLITRVANRVLKEHWANCSNISILPLQAFYPIDWMNIGRFFQRPTIKRETKWQASELEWINQGAYALHLWNKCSNQHTVEKGSVMETLFKRSCLFCKQVKES